MVIGGIDLEALKRAGIEKRQQGHDFVYRYPPSSQMPMLDVGELKRDIGGWSGEAALYLHVPFCTSLCSFCHYFKKRPQGRSEIEGYLQGVEKEIEGYAGFLGKELKAGSVFFGGGTPTMLGAGQLLGLLELVREKFGLGKQAEATVESSPETLTEGKLVELREGFNRLSVGVQALDDGLLQRFCRGHSAEQALGAMKMAEAAGFENVNLDLIYGLPGQSLESWRETLAKVGEMRPSSVTASDLRVLPEAAMYGQNVELVPAQRLLEMYRLFVEKMLRIGYVQQFPYQFVRKGNEMQFLENQWSNGSFIGFGASSCSWIAKWDYNNWLALPEYGKAVRERGLSAVLGKKLEQREWMIRMVSLGLKRSGIGRKEFGVGKREFKERFGIEIEEAFPKQLEKLRGLGLVKENERFFGLSEKGLFFHDEVGKLFWEK